MWLQRSASFVLEVSFQSSHSKFSILVKINCTHGHFEYLSNQPYVIAIFRLECFMVNCFPLLSSRAYVWLASTLLLQWSSTHSQWCSSCSHIYQTNAACWLSSQGLSVNIFIAQIYRVIHKSLRDFRTRPRNNQDRHGRKEHINR